MWRREIRLQLHSADEAPLQGTVRSPGYRRFRIRCYTVREIGEPAHLTLLLDVTDVDIKVADG